MWAIRAERVFDGRSVRTAGALVVIDGETIVGIEPRDADLSDGRIVEAPGTVLPGMVDTHVHLCGDGRRGALDRLEFYDDAELPPIIEDALRRSLAAGVTTVRDLGDRRFAILDWLASRPAGCWPTVLTAGPPITSVRGHCWNMGGEVAGESQLRRAVALSAERGVDVVKVMASGGFMTAGSTATACQFTDDELRVVVSEAHRLGLPVTAHAHPLVAVDQAVHAGVDGIEHCTGLTDKGLGVPKVTITAVRDASVTVCPTLGQTAVFAPPPAVLAMLADRGLTPELLMQQTKVQAARLLAAGVRVVSGTDAGVGEVKPHGLVAYALEALVAGGADPAPALASATSVAAEAIGMGRRKGRIAIGYDADLVVVDGDPSVDIVDLQRIRQVYVGGEPAWPSAIAPPHSRRSGGQSEAG